MKRKKNACFKKKKDPKLCIVVLLCTEQEKQLYYSGLCLQYPGHIVKPSLKCNERIIWQRENGLKLVAQCLHLAVLQVFHNQSLYSGNLECMSIQISAA